MPLLVTKLVGFVNLQSQRKAREFSLVADAATNRVLKQEQSG
jgi:hypothetical protein